VLATAVVILAVTAVGVAPAAERSSPPFADVTTASGLAFRHESGMTGGLHLPEIMGPGAALLDVDGDGDLDAFLVQGGRLTSDGRPIPGSARHRLFLNDLHPRPGGGSEACFSDASDAFQLPEAGYGMGVAAGDIDNDGWTDLIVTQYGTDLLLRNDRGRRFEDVTERLGTARPGWSVSATFFDYDRDGWLDLFIARYVEYQPIDCFLASTRRNYCGATSEAAASRTSPTACWANTTPAPAWASSPPTSTRTDGPISTSPTTAPGTTFGSIARRSASKRPPCSRASPSAPWADRRRAWA
jgi:hypothetical protein